MHGMAENLFLTLCPRTGIQSVPGNLCKSQILSFFAFPLLSSSPFPLSLLEITQSNWITQDTRPGAICWVTLKREWPNPFTK